MLTRCYDIDWDVQIKDGSISLWDFNSGDLSDILNDETVEAITEAYWEEKAAGESEW